MAGNVVISRAVRQPRPVLVLVLVLVLDRSASRHDVLPPKTPTSASEITEASRCVRIMGEAKWAAEDAEGAEDDSVNSAATIDAFSGQKSRE